MTQSVSLKLHKLGNCRCAVSEAEVDEVHAVDEFVDIELGLAGLAFRLAHLAARHVEDADLGKIGRAHV